MAQFKLGDILLNVRPYMGECEQLVKSLNEQRREYNVCGIKGGKVLWHSTIPYDHERYYKVVG